MMDVDVTLPMPKGMGYKKFEKWKKGIQPVLSDVVQAGEPLKELFETAELKKLNQRMSFNFAVKNLLPLYELSESAKFLIAEFMRVGLLYDLHKLVSHKLLDKLCDLEIEAVDKALADLPAWRISDCGTFWIHRQWIAPKFAVVHEVRIGRFSDETGKYFRWDFERNKSGDILAENLMSSAALSLLFKPEFVAAKLEQANEALSAN